MDRIHSKWRPPRGHATKQRRASRKNLIIARAKQKLLRLKRKEYLAAEELKLFQELNLKKEHIHSVNENSMETTPYNSVNVNDDVSKMAVIVKEEIDIKEEIYDDLMIGMKKEMWDDLMFDTTEFNTAQDASLSSPPPNNSNSNLITQEFPLKQVDKISNSNDVHNGNDDPLNAKAVESIFSSLEKHDKGIEQENVSQVHGCPKCYRKFESQKLVNNHMSKGNCWGFKKKTDYKGKYIKLCSKCDTLTKSNSVGKCSVCSAKFHVKCTKCQQTFENYDKFLHHHPTQCILQGYYHCLECDFKSKYSNFVRNHLSKFHLDLRKSKPNFDLKSYIKWKEVAKDENGGKLPLHICPKCRIAYKHVRSFNQHVKHCRRGQVFRAINPKDNDSKIVLNCGKCNKDAKYYFFYCQQPLCTDCRTILKFKCILCDKLMNHDVCAAVHAKSTCSGQQKLYSCKVCGISFDSSDNLLKHEEQHLETTYQEVEVPLELDSPDLTDNFVQNPLFPNETKNQVDLGEDNLFVPVKEKYNSESLSCQTRDTKFEQNSDLTRHWKHCEEKLQMQCKVVLTQLKVDKS